MRAFCVNERQNHTLTLNMNSMNNRLIACSFLVVLSVFLSGCTGEDADRLRADFVTIPDMEAADATLKKLLGQSRFNMSKVSVARMEIDGRPVEVTSLVPAAFRGYRAQVRRFEYNDGRSFSLVLFDQDDDRLIFFTRDQAKQKAYKLLVPLASVEAKKHYRFPFTDESAKVNEAEIHFKELKSR